MGEMITITMQDKVRQYPKGVSLHAIAKEVQKEYQDDIILALFENKLMELRGVLNRDGNLHFLTTADKNGKRAYRRSVVFLMQRALMSLYPRGGVDIVVDHSLGQGYYCRITGDIIVNEQFLQSLEKEMRSLVEKDLPLQKRSIKTVEARRIFASRGMTDKENLMKYRTSSNINVYELDGCIDYFYGYMASSTGMLSYFALYPYEEGFVLQFPDKNTKEVAEFHPANKLFHVLQASEKWGKDMEIPTVGALNDAICQGKTRDIILTQEAYMERRIGALAEKIVADPNKKFVLIAGPSSSGKTTFSHRLSAQLRALGVNPHPIPLDDYYLDRDQIPLDEFGEKDFESIEGLDIELFNSDMQKLLHGERVLLPSFNFKIGKREYKDHYMQLGNRDILVIEGIHGLNERMSASLPKESKFKIYISALTQLNIDEHNPLATTDGRLIRRIVRDARTRGTIAKDTIAMWDSVRRGEEKNIFPFQEQADEMFNSALIYEMAVLKTYAQPQLFAIEPDCKEYAEAKRLLKLLDYFLTIPADDICNNSIVREFIGGSCFNV
ncbi:MAG: nucleoside kinase [Lachnospiraceae bacterium]|nr:nucleoside kinase [Lachnospiraceae bacterium]